MNIVYDSFSVAPTSQHEDETLTNDLKCDCYAHPFYYNNYTFDYDEDYDQDYYYYSDYKIDFYDYLENKCLRTPNGHFSPSQKTSILFNDEILNFNLLKLKVEKNDKSRVASLLEMLKKSFGNTLSSSNSHSTESEIKLVKALLCWQAQFNDIKTVEFIVNYAAENNLCSDVSRLADFVIDSNEASTLTYSIHSHSLDMVKLVIEKYGADFSHVYKDGTTAIHYAVIENVPTIIKYLLRLFSQNKPNYLDMLEFSEKTRPPLDIAIEGKSQAMTYNKMNR